MKNIHLALAILAIAAPSVPALAQPYQLRNEQSRDLRAADQEYHGDRDVDNSREGRKAQREHARNLAEANRNAGQANRGWRRYADYEWDRREPGMNRYDAGRYYRSGDDYRTRTLAANDRIYRGQNGRYYCRRSDGTTGLIIGAAAGGLLGNTLVRGDSQVLGTLVGAAGGAFAGQALKRDGVRCR